MATYVSGTVSMVGNTNTYTDAMARAWIPTIRAALSGVGLVQTSDTGQVNPATATAGANADFGYEVWRFSDAAQATDPLFLRIRYRRSGGNCLFFLIVQTGQGSDGAGNLTGTVSAATNAGAGSSNTGTTVNAQVHAFFNDGCFWLADGTGAVGGAYGSISRNFFLVARSRNTSGALDARGVTLLAPNGGFTNSQAHTSQFIRTASGSKLAHNATSQFCMVVGNPTNDYAPGTSDQQAWPHFYYDRGVGVRQCWSHFTAKTASMPTVPTAFQADPFGTGSRYWTSWVNAPRAVDIISSNVRLVVPWDAP